MEISWRGRITSRELNVLHAECFGGRIYADDEWDWAALCARHSLGWACAREGEELAGFANVLWDGAAHAWLQDVMVAPAARHGGLGARLVELARDRALEAGCEWLHVDFAPALAPFYLGACGFEPAHAGLMRLAP
ncbi:MAG TPA: GNAT family N-acetyltransferase [Gaiellales bacterium]|jgi:GNAT superfamily N-acetyltransferase